MGAPMKLGGQNGYRLSNPEGFCVAAGTYGHWLQGHALTGSAFECCSLGIGLKNACKNLIPKMCFVAASHMAPTMRSSHLQASHMA